MDQMKTGAFISGLRKSKNLTQEQFASIIGVTQKSVSRWETGRNMPDLSLLQPIAEELGVTVTELLNGEKSSTPVEEKTEEAVARLIDYTVQMKRTPVFSRKELRMIVWSCLALCAALLGIGAFIQLQTVPLMILGILLITVIMWLLCGRCPGCGNVLPLMIKETNRCPYCGKDLRTEGRE